jgi:hypothetical protein
MAEEKTGETGSTTLTAEKSFQVPVPTLYVKDIDISVRLKYMHQGK